MTTKTYDNDDSLISGARRNARRPIRHTSGDGDVVTEDHRTADTDRRREVTIPELAARGTRGIVAVSQRFAANMTIGSFFLVLAIAVGGGAVAFWMPLFNDNGGSITPAMQRQNDHDKIKDLERQQDHDATVGELRNAQQDRDIAEIKQIVTENQTFIADVRQFMTIIYTGMGAIGALLGGVLVGVLTLLIQRWLKIKV